MDPKLSALSSLWNTIKIEEGKYGIPWRWPALDGVNGWDGTDDIVLVSYAPGEGDFGPADFLIYDSLAKCHAQNAHITSVFKNRVPFSRRKYLELDHSSVEKHQSYLREEFRIVQPRCVVPLTDQAKTALQRWAAAIGLDPALIRPIVSPWSRRPNDAFQTQLCSAISNAGKPDYPNVDTSPAPTRSVTARPELHPELEDLRLRIVHELLFRRARQVWFWPEALGLSGWMGSADLLIAGSYPSAVMFPDESDEFFFNTASQMGLREAHFTDLLKTSAKDKQALARVLADDDLMRLQMKHLKSEIEIIAPSMVIIMGTTTAKSIFEMWRPYLDVDHITVCFIPHFKVRSLRDQFVSNLRACVHEYWKIRGEMPDG